MKTPSRFYPYTRMLIVGLLLAPLANASIPPWWITSGVLNTNATPNDYAIVLQGQVKNMAAAAFAQTDVLPGGPGATLTTLINSFSPTNNYLLTNIGQLKNVAQPFYDRLIAVGYTNAYPWNPASTSNDYLAANIGQLKNLFSWDLSYSSLNDGIPNWWRAYYFGGNGTTTNIQSCVSCDPTDDGFTNLQKFDCGLSPLVTYAITAPSSVASNSTGNTASVPNFGWSSYTWSITDGTLTSGQGSPSITWTAGRLRSATISLTASENSSCHASLSASVPIAPANASLTTIFEFNGDTGGPAAGFLAQGPLVQGCDGNFYSALYSGGTDGLGSIFRVTSAGTFTTLYTFGCGSDQAGPADGFVLGSDSNFYGATYTGGCGMGTVFRISTAGTFTTLYSFTDSDGCSPSGLVLGPDGNFSRSNLDAIHPGVNRRQVGGRSEAAVSRV